MLLKFRKNKSLIGLDVGASSIKLLELGGQAGRYSVEAYVCVPLPEDAIIDKEIKDAAAIVAAIIKALEVAKPKASAFALAMPASLVITKTIQLESNLSPKELESQIQIDAARYVPYALEEVSLDFDILGINPKDETKMEVLLAAARRENVESRVDTVAETGLPVRVVDVESFTLERALTLIANKLPDEGIGKHVGVMNIGATVSSLTVLDSMNVIYTREEAFGGKQLTDLIRSRFEKSYEQAEQAKRQGDLPPEYENEILPNFRDTLATQVQRALQFYYSASEAELDALVLAGGTASITGLVEAIQKQTGITTIVANPFEKMEVASRVNRANLMRDASSLLVACGLAMRSFT